MTLVVDNSAPAAAAAPAYRRSYRRRTTRYRRPAYRRSYRRSRYGRRRRYSRVSRGVVGLHKLPKFIKAQIDPFDRSVGGVKIPDSNTYPSTALTSEDQWLGQSTDANGLCAYAFLPSLKNAKVNHTASSTSAWTWSAAYAGGEDSGRLTSIANNYTLVRPVAHGIKISCSGAPTTTTGNLHVAIVAATSFGKSTWNLPVNISQMSNGMFYKKYPLAMFTQQTLTIVNKFIDCTATRYLDPSSDGVASAVDVEFQTNGWATICIAVEGGPASTALLAIEEVLHLEAIPKVEAVDSSSSAAPFNINTLQGASHLAGNVPAAFTEQERQSYFQDVTAAVQGGVYDAASSAYHSYGLPFVRRAAGFATSAALSYAARRVYGLPGITDYRNPSAFTTYM